jgi:hypothetical protein
MAALRLKHVASLSLNRSCSDLLGYQSPFYHCFVDIILECLGDQFFAFRFLFRTCQLPASGRFMDSPSKYFGVHFAMSAHERRGHLGDG